MTEKSWTLTDRAITEILPIGKFLRNWKVVKATAGAFGRVLAITAAVREEKKLTLTENDLPLQCVYRWERERADRIFLTQPCGKGKVRDWTWAQAASEVRRIAAHLRAQNWEPGSRIAILSKNCAWWIMSDLAIWMAGHVTVPVYPSLKPQSVRQILEHSECKGCFFGDTDD